MFAGGMAIGVPSFMPGATADLSSTDGLLTVSSTEIQGAAVLEIVVNDPDLSDTTVDINSGATVDFGGTTYDMSQGVNGKWYLYIVDASVAALMDAENNGLEYGVLCTAGLGIAANDTTLIVDAATDIYAAAGQGMGTVTSVVDEDGDFAGGCLDIDNMLETFDDASTTVIRDDLTATILTAAPALSNHNSATAGQSDIDLGQLGHGLNASGYGSWPYIVSVNFTDDNLVEYGSDSVNVVYGNTDDSTSISLANNSPADMTEVHLTITDPGLNIDPTGVDKWLFSLSDNDGDTTTVEWAKNGTTNDPFSAAELGEMQCVQNCALWSDATGVLATGANAVTAVVMTESGSNTGVFESFDANGDAQFTTTDQATGDTKIIFSYGGNDVDMIITYNDATLDLAAPDASWAPASSATVTVTDADQNKNPSSAETLYIYDEEAVIPTIKVGTPLTLATGSNACLDEDNVLKNINVCLKETSVGGGDASFGVNVGDTGGGAVFGVEIYNTTDDSERLRIQHNGTDTGGQVADSSGTTWINVTTGHTRSDIVALAGTTVLSYNVQGPADTLSSTAISVYLLDSGSNDSCNTAGCGTEVLVQSVGNVKAGVVDIDDGTHYVVSQDIHGADHATWTGTTTLESNGATTNGFSNSGDNLVTVAFKFTHAVGDSLGASDNYAISADFCNFDQNNASLVHNCIYRIEATETGADTGIFEGSVSYINLNNSTSINDAGTTVAHAGTHQGNDHEVEGLLDVDGSDVTVVLMDSVSGSDSVRVVYNDTDSFQVTDKIGAQLETSTHTATISLDADTYGVDDIGTITIVDADLNQDSGIRDTYTNSTTTFQMTIDNEAGNTPQKPFSGTITIIETGADTGEFIGTFKVPNFKGADMELTYYESRDAGGSAVSYYDVATIASNTGSISLDRAIYPVPWTASTLYDGAGTAGGNTAAGEVVAWITVTDPDETGDTLTTGSTTAAGSIIAKIGTTTCFTAGSIAAISAGANPAELGPLSEVSPGSSAFEISMTIQETTDCGSDVSVQSGAVLQVEYVDTADDSGSSSTSYDSATFDMRTGTLSVDKDVYVMGSDMVVTITDPDLNVDSASYESYSLNLLEWDSSADSSELLSVGSGSIGFSANPSTLEETGTDTGVFQTVVTLPVSQISSGNSPEFGESVILTYVDASLSGESDVAGDTTDIEAYFSISDFGALIELDKALYNWTDTVYITITAPDHNNNSAAEETIGTSALPIQATSRAGKMCSGSFYVAAETGPDTGVFEAEIALQGYVLTQSHNGPASVANTCSTTDSTAGKLKTAGQTDGVSVSYEYNNNVVVVASASIAFNIAEASFDSSSAGTGGSVTLSVTDADENANSAIIEDFNVDVYSDSDNGGFTLSMSETNEDTGVFEGTVYFTDSGASSGNTLRVSEGDTVTAEYSDKTLPEPYTDSDTLTVASTLTIGTAFPPLERAPAANARVVDAFGSSVAEVSVDQQVQIAADVSNGQSKDQAFAYLVQVQDSDGVTVSLAWITGSLTAGQSMSPALSWTPGSSGSYTATVFVWESVDNPTALSPTTSVSIDVV
jgi:hypothetical protein